MINKTDEEIKTTVRSIDKLDRQRDKDNSDKELINETDV